MTDAAVHARNSPSTAHRRIPCPGSLALEEKLPSSTSSFAEEGTGAHELASWALTDGVHMTAAYLGRITANGTEVTREMCEFIQIYVDNILDYAKGKRLLVEQRVVILGTDGKVLTDGTSDAIIIDDVDNELQVHDLKYGMGVKVYAEKNEQLMGYTLGAVDEYGIVELFDKFRVVIHQPRLQWLDEWDFELDELNAFRVALTNALTRAVIYADFGPEDARLGPDPVLNPGDKQCRFCRAKAICPALAAKVAKEVSCDFEDVTLTPPTADDINDTMTPQDLGNKMQMIDLIENWCRAIRAEVERRLFAGIAVPGYKLVEGKRGSREWRMKEEAETLLKSMRLRMDEMYTLKLVSPAQAEKLLKKESPKRWKKCEELIIQREGQPSVAPENDKRPPLVVKTAIEDFSNLDDAEDFV